MRSRTTEFALSRREHWEASNPTVRPATSACCSCKVFTARATSAGHAAVARLCSSIAFCSSK
eukprot:15444081-Alexandrium_andersonii.AAC.1